MDRKDVWDCLMVGAGPAALSAAIYTARENIKTLLIEKAAIGGLAALTDKIDNYPGFSHGVLGLQLSEQLQNQALRFGAQIDNDAVVSLDFNSDQLIFKIKLESGQTKLARTVLIASGCQFKKLKIAGEAKFYGRGVHNCATCDGAFYKDKKLVIVGGGNSSAQESLYLTRFARSIDILIRKDHWKASPVLVSQIENHPKIRVHFETQAVAIEGQSTQLERVLAKKKQKRLSFKTDGVFVFIGLKPTTDFFGNLKIDLDDFGFIKTDQALATNFKGVFCAGDVRSGATMQIAAAVGEGARAALSIRHYLDDL